MEIVKQVSNLRTHLKKARQEGKSIGLVPTMGYLHEGHLSLMRKAKAEHDVVVASIFVNPLQFGPKEDYKEYPRDLKRDSKLAESAGVDFLFAPAVEDLYPGGVQSMLAFVDIIGLGERLCGATRPGHFRGVLTVVTKLLHIAMPDTAYFGQKDAQQAIIIKKMVKDLNFSSQIVMVPIIREPDGLAMSSRNVFLNPKQRKAALALSKSLRLAEERLNAGERDASLIVKEMRNLILSEPLASIDYISVNDPDNLEELKRIEEQALVALAVRFGKTRLIDNLLWTGGKAGI